MIRKSKILCLAERSGGRCKPE